ncbi:hypothetical protein AB0I28_36325 [Phytomonospora sp. NPDC050363]|uniref:hypothetical protein n=1 Tax=Phytomonospora sp. NPDC050363 TaxID=3155642 RepID=UPI0033FCE09D
MVTTGLIDLDPEGGEHEVVLAFEDLTREQRNLLTTRCRLPAAVAGLGHLTTCVYPERDIRLHVTTTRPQDTADALWNEVPTELTRRAVVATRPKRVSAFDVAHPADRTGYTPPID